MLLALETQPSGFWAFGGLSGICDSVLLGRRGFGVRGLRAFFVLEIGAGSMCFGVWGAPRFGWNAGLIGLERRWVSDLCFIGLRDRPSGVTSSGLVLRSCSFRFKAGFIVPSRFPNPPKPRLSQTTPVKTEHAC